MKKHHDSANEQALDELTKRNVKRGMNYHNGPEYAEHESREISRRTLAQKVGAKQRDASSTDEYKSGLINGRRYMTDDDFADYYRSSREEAPIKNAHADTSVVLQKVDRERHEIKERRIRATSEKKDVRAELKRAADRVNPKQQGESIKSSSKPKESNAKSKLAKEVKVAAKAWIPVDEMMNEEVREGKKEKLPLNVIFAIVLVTVSLLLIVGSMVLLATAKQERGQLQNEIELLDQKIEQLQSDLDKKNEEADIEIFAKEELGMISQEHINAEYINTNKTDGVNKNEPSSHTLSSLISWFFAFLK